MEELDYIIVGDGYAGLFFAHQLIKNNKTFKIFSDGKKSASKISAGIINPMVLKRFTSFWLSKEQIEALQKTASEIELYTGKNYLLKTPIKRIFHDEVERKLWLTKTIENTDVKDFLDPNLEHLEVVKNPFGVGTVNFSARWDVDHFFKDMLQFLSLSSNIIFETFNYSLLNSDQNQYKNFKFKNIVFAEGMGVLNNPYFSKIPVIANKGHHLMVKLSEPIKNNGTLKKKHFLFPQEGLYYYGGTYDRDHLSQDVDAIAVDELKNGLSEFYPFNFEIEEIRYGFRSTVQDRRPILGNHRKNKNFYVFNGLGARGVLNGNYFADVLYQFIENKVPIEEEIDVNRFSNLI